MLPTFFDRKSELNQLKKEFDRDEFRFILIYGRRRIGKTRLVKKAIEDNKSFYFLSKKTKPEKDLDRLINHFNKKFDINITAETFEEFFEELKKRFDNLIFCIDEFSFWVEKDDAICSTFQIIIDEILKDTKIKLILLGSSISIMESLLSYKNPLYGRSHTRINLSHVKIKELLKEKNMSIKNSIKLYGLTNNIPAYMNELNYNPTKDMINKTFFNKYNLLNSDAERILKDEFRNYVLYLNILFAISEGKTKLKEISNYTKTDISNISKYLKILETLRLIKREWPITINHKKPTKGIWKINDFFFKFWMKFVYPNIEEIELENFKFKHIEKDFNRYLGFVFEEYIKELIKTIYPKFKFGRWWHKEKEIDIVGLNKREIIFSECKYKDNVNPEKLYNKLKKKKNSVKWNKNNRKEKYILFAKSFNSNFKKDDLELIDFDKLKSLVINY